MKASLSMLTLSIACAIALAQEAPKNATPQEAPQRTTPTADAKANTNAQAGTALPEMKTSSFKGVLVDMSCAGTSAGTAAPASAAQPSDSAKAPETNTANRSASDSGANCPVSASSTNMGLKLEDGRTVRFDLVGNQRAQDELKNNKKWTKAIGENKPIQAKVSGVLNGDKLIVASIH